MSSAIFVISDKPYVVIICAPMFGFLSHSPLGNRSKDQSVTRQIKIKKVYKKRRN